MLPSRVARGILLLEASGHVPGRQIGRDHAVARHAAHRRTACARCGRGRETIRDGAIAARRKRHADAAPARNGRRDRCGRPRTTRPICRKPVTPPQRVTSACCTSTAPASSIVADIVGRVGIFAGRDVHSRRRVVANRGASPARSSDDTGSSNQPTSCSRESVRQVERLLDADRRRWRRRTASRRRSRCLATRRGADRASGSVPIFILTNAQPSFVHPAGELVLAARSSE